MVEFDFGCLTCLRLRALREGEKLTTTVFTLGKTWEQLLHSEIQIQWLEIRSKTIKQNAEWSNSPVKIAICNR